MSTTFLCVQPETKKKKETGSLRYLLTVSESHILRLTKAHTRLSPGCGGSGAEKSELRRTPLFSKHSYRGEELIIQRGGLRRPHLTVPQKKGQSSSCEEPPGSVRRQPEGRARCMGGGWGVRMTVEEGEDVLGHVMDSSSNMAARLSGGERWYFCTRGMHSG